MRFRVLSCVVLMCSCVQQLLPPHGDCGGQRGARRAQGEDERLRERIADSNGVPQVGRAGEDPARAGAAHRPAEANLQLLEYVSFCPVTAFTASLSCLSASCPCVAVSLSGIRHSDLPLCILHLCHLFHVSSTLINALLIQVYCACYVHFKWK